MCNYQDCLTLYGNELIAGRVERSFTLQAFGVPVFQDLVNICV